MFYLITPENNIFVNSIYRLNDDVNFLFLNDIYYLYSPSARTYCSLNADMKIVLDSFDGNRTIKTILDLNNLPNKLIGALKMLVKRNILVDTPTSKSKELKPSFNTKGFNDKLSLFPTTRCNLKCKYCYADGGDNIRVMSRDLWLVAMDFFLNNIDAKASKPSLSIHGGGEPTSDPTLLKNICKDYQDKCIEKGINTKISITSNGAFSLSIMKWILSNNIGLSISFDGPHEVQNHQRPFRNGKPSYNKVIGNIRTLIRAGRRVAIRSTITSGSIESMLQTVELAKHEGIKAVHFEPVFQTGRGVKNNLALPPEERFCELFLDCFRKGLEYDIDVSYSGMRCFDSGMGYFCSACGHNFGVTPEGNITCCYEVLDRKDPASDVFFIGHIDTNSKTVKLFEDRLKYLRSRKSNNAKLCPDCYLRYNCAGDCLAKAFRASGDLFGHDDYRCRLAKKINGTLIAWLADGIISVRNPTQYESIEVTC